MSKMLAKMNLISVVQQLPNEDIELVQNYVEMIEEENKELKKQQKEFINWLEDGIQKVKNTKFLDESIQRAGLIAYNRCLQKYKSITGVEKWTSLK